MTTTETAKARVRDKSSRWAFLTDGPPIRKPVFYSVGDRRPGHGDLGDRRRPIRPSR